MYLSSTYSTTSAGKIARLNTTLILKERKNFIAFLREDRARFKYSSLLFGEGFENCQWMNSERFTMLQIKPWMNYRPHTISVCHVFNQKIFRYQGMIKYKRLPALFLCLGPSVHGFVCQWCSSCIPSTPMKGIVATDLQV